MNITIAELYDLIESMPESEKLYYVASKLIGKGSISYSPPMSDLGIEYSSITLHPNYLPDLIATFGEKLVRLQDKKGRYF